MNVLDLFSGIGGFSLGLERAGFKTVAFCEIDPYCRAVLRKHWPNVPCYDDVRNVSRYNLWADGIEVDAICGGFPCQDISRINGVWGDRLGLVGERSGLWSDFARIIGDIRPRYVIVENVADLLRRDLGQVLGDLAALGYDAEWHCIPAAYIGARHIRDRVWIIANSVGDGLEGPIQIGQHIATSLKTHDRRAPSGETGAADWEGWASEPAFLGKTDAFPGWMDAIAGLGNAIVPQIAEIIGRAIKWHLSNVLNPSCKRPTSPNGHPSDWRYYGNMSGSERPPPK